VRPCGVAFEGECRLSGVIRAPRYEPHVRGAEAYALDGVNMSVEAKGFFSGLHVAPPHRVVIAPGHDAFAIGVGVLGEGSGLPIPSLRRRPPNGGAFLCGDLCSAPRETTTARELLTSGYSLGRDAESFFERRLGSDRKPLGYVRTPNDLSKSAAERGSRQERGNPGKHRGKRKQPRGDPSAVAAYSFVVVRQEFTATR